jgi:nucleotide-binding universal stress UspA family protein
MYERILVPVDGSPTSIVGLDAAIELARLTGASIRLVHVVDQLTFATGFEVYTGDLIGLLREAGEKILGEAKARASAGGVPVTAFLCEIFGSRVCDVVIEQAKEWRADLVVIGSHGRRGMSRLFLGSDAEMVVRTAPVPVLVVRGAEAAADRPSGTGEAAAAPQRSAVPA